MTTALPNLHPAVVHLVLVLAPLALLLDALALLPRLREKLAPVATGAWMLAAPAAWLAFLAGRSAADGLGLLPPEPSAALSEHADTALLASLALTAVALLRAGLEWRVPGRAVGPGLGLLFGSAVAAQVGLAADRGGALVYQHGVAVASPPPPACPEAAVCEPAGDGRTIEVTGEQLILWPQVEGDTQVSASLDLGDFEGRVGALHRWGEAPGGFLVDTRTGLGSLESGGRELDQAELELGDELRIAVSASGSHYKGYVGDEMVTHGHTSASEPGRPGLLLQGEGRVVVHDLQVLTQERDHDEHGHAH